MKILQSYWSKPLIMNDNSDGIFRSTGGWATKVTLYASRALSCLKLKEFYGNVEFITDKHGKSLFCDLLELPFTKVKVELDNINDYDQNLWALGKIYSYSIQDEPFLHVDSDVFIWSPFPEQLLKAPVIGQSLETNFEHNIDYFKHIEPLLDYTPAAILRERQNTNDIIEVNAGILGGNNIPFFKEYTREAFEMVDRNMDFFSQVTNKGAFNMVYEQFLLYCLAKERNIPVNLLLSEEYFIFSGYCDFDCIPVLGTYTHALGTYKKFHSIGNHIVERLKYEYPYYYDRIISLISRNFI
ncbi:MAG: hypothetical protein LIP08_11155 [Bacteroides sp.]|nr:hypothetical protein [Bacteroides sp.]